MRSVDAPVSKASDAETVSREEQEKTVEKLNAVKKATDAMLDPCDSNTANKKLAEAKAKMDQEQAKVEDEMAKTDQNVRK